MTLKFIMKISLSFVLLVSGYNISTCRLVEKRCEPPVLAKEKHSMDRMIKQVFVP